MMVYAPQPDAAFARILGGLSAEQAGIFETRLRDIAPSVRYRLDPEATIHPGVLATKYTLMLHRDDRSRTIEVVNDVLDQVSPRLARLDRYDRDLAALIRQIARAQHAKDDSAEFLMESYILQNVKNLLEDLLARAKIRWDVKLWFDGIGGEKITFTAPFGLRVLGYIWVGDTQAQEPFEADLQASEQAQELKNFSARFGNRSQLIADGVIRQNVTELHAIGERIYCVRVGDSVPRRDGQLVDWAFEFVKQ